MTRMWWCGYRKGNEVSDAYLSRTTAFGPIIVDPLFVTHYILTFRGTIEWVRMSLIDVIRIVGVVQTMTSTKETDSSSGGAVMCWYNAESC